jgi:uncharacterized protein YbjQ (UPF0145 family)
LAKCRDCSTKMGYAESQAAQNYNGLCITCHVKDRVQTRVLTSQEPVLSSTQKSTEIVLNKFQDMLVTTETSFNLNIKKRCGVISTDFHYEFKRTPLLKKIWNALRGTPEKSSDFLQESLEMAMLEIKSKAIRLEANCIIGLNVDYIVLGDFKKDGLIISLMGTCVKV